MRKEEATNSLLDSVDTFGVPMWQFVGCNWLLNFGTVRDRSMASRLVLGSNWRVVMKSVEGSFNIARNGEVAFVVGVILSKGDAIK